MNTCPECGKMADDGEAVRSWFWLRRGGEGFWACSVLCLRELLAKTTLLPVEQWIPNPEEVKRMSE